MMLAATTAGWGPGVTLGSTPAISAAIWAMVLIAVVVLGGLAVMALRQRLLAKDGDVGGVGGMSLDQLRAMRRRGELSEEEYEVARDALTSALTGRPAGTAPRRPAGGRTDGALVAPPGFDLTGQPLPRPTPEPPDRGGEAAR